MIKSGLADSTAFTTLKITLEGLIAGVLICSEPNDSRVPLLIIICLLKFHLFSYLIDPFTAITSFSSFGILFGNNSPYNEPMTLLFSLQAHSLISNETNIEIFGFIGFHFKCTI